MFLAHFQGQYQTQKNEMVFQKMSNFLENIYDETNGAIQGIGKQIYSMKEISKNKLSQVLDHNLM